MTAERSAKVSQPVQEAPQPVAAEQVSPAMAAVEADAQYVLLPVERSDLGLIKCMKFNQQELDALEKWGELLAVTVHPATGMPFVQRGARGKVEFASLMKFCINTTFNLMGQIFRQLAEEEGKGG